MHDYQCVSVNTADHVLIFYKEFTVWKIWITKVNLFDFNSTWMIQFVLPYNIGYTVNVNVKESFLYLRIMFNGSSTTRLTTSTPHLDVCSFYRNVRDGDVTPQDILVLVGAINALLSVVAVTGNTLILAAIWKNSSLRSPSYILLAGLAATDFATGLITQPLYVAYIFAGNNCTVVTAADVASRYFATVTAETITMMSVERWLHMSRRSLITVRRAYLIYGILLFLPVAYLPLHLWLVSMQSYGDFWKPLLHGVLSVICFSTTSFSYYKVFGIIRNQLRRVQAGQTSQSSPMASIKYKKSVYTILIILLVFLLCYSPHGITIFAHSLWTMSAVTFNVVWHFTATLVLISSSINPLLYYWRIREIRLGVKRLMRGIIC